MPREIVNPGDIPRIAVAPKASSFTGGSQAFAQLAVKFRKKAQDLAILRSRREGALAGTKGPTELRKGVRIQDQAFNDAANQNSLNRLQVQIRDELVVFEQENPINGVQFLELSNAAITSRVSELKTQDAELASILAARAAGFQRSAILRIRNASITNEREEGRASIIENEVLNLTEIQQQTEAFFQEDTDIVTQAVASVAEAYADMERMWLTPDPGGQGTLIPADKIVERRVSTILGIYEQLISGFIRSHGKPGEVGEAMDSGEFTMPTIGVNQLGEVLAEGEITVFNPKRDLPPEIFNRLIRLTRTEQGRRNQDAAGERELGRSLALQKFDAFSAELQANSASSITLTDNELLAITRGDEVEARRLRDEINNKQEIASLVPLVKAESVQDTQDRIEATEVEGLDAPEELRMLEALKAVQVQKITELENDPFAYVRSGEFGGDATAVFQSGAMDEPTYRRLMMDLQSATAKGLRSFFPSAMDKDEAAEFVEAYSLLRNPQEMTQAVQSLQAKFGTGDLLESALNDFKDAGFPKAAIMLASMDSRSRAASLLVHAMQFGTSELNKSIKDTISPADLDADIDEEMFELVSALPPNNIALIEATRDAWRLIARGAMHFDQAASSEAIKTAREALIDSRWVIENETLIIVGKDTEQVKAAVTSRGVDALIDFFADQIDPALDGTTTLSRFDFIEQLREDGRLVPDEDGNGLEMVDGAGRPVLLTNGKKLLARFDKELFDIGEDLIIASKTRFRLVSGLITAEDLRESRLRERTELERQERLIAEHRALIKKRLDEERQFLTERGVKVRGMTEEEIFFESSRLRDVDRTK